MKLFNKLFAAGLIALTITSCTVVLPVTASEAEIGDKRGVSESTVFLGIYFNKNYGLGEAAKKGGIDSAIATIDEETKSFVFFQKKKLIVTAK